MGRGLGWWIGLAALVGVITLAGPVELARGARAAWHGYAMKQQTQLLRDRGPLVQAYQNAGMEMRVLEPDADLDHDRRVRVLDRRDDYAAYSDTAFGRPQGAQLVVNNGSPQVMVWVDAPQGQPDYFEGWILASDLGLWGNSGVVTVWDGDGRTVQFAMSGIF